MELRFYETFSDERDRRAKLNNLLSFARRLDAPTEILDALVWGYIYIKTPAGNLAKRDIHVYLVYDREHWWIRDVNFVRYNESNEAIKWEARKIGVKYE